MAKKIYTGVENIARNVSKVYIGVGEVARKVKKGYIGVDGVARLFYSTGEPIDVGSAAVYGDTPSGKGTTKINKSNPANLNGTIKQVEVYVDTAISGCIIAIFYSTGTNIFTVRSRAIVGTLSTGLVQITGLSLNVQAGDYIGIYYTDGAMRATSHAGTGYWYLAGDYTNCVGTTFSLNSTNNYALSLYGTGTT